MTLDQALKSRFPMKRPYWTFYVEPWGHPQVTFRKCTKPNEKVHLWKYELVATNWVILICEKHDIEISTAENDNHYGCLQCINPATLPCYYPKPTKKQDVETIEILNSDNLKSGQLQAKDESGQVIVIAEGELQLKCECGAESCESTMHSEWCPKGE